MNNESLGHAHDNLIALFLCNQILVTITMPGYCGYHSM